MRCLAAVALLSGAARAWSAPPAAFLFALPAPGSRSSAVAPSAASRGDAAASTEVGNSLRRAARSGRRSGSVGLGALVGVATAALIASRSLRRRGSGLRPRWGVAGATACRAEGEAAEGEAAEGEAAAPKEKKKRRIPTRYINPWQQHVDNEEEIYADPEDRPSGWRFHHYGGPVHNQVPIVEGLQFPLDPEKYYPPLEPPKAGVKWGDGREQDGNWYMEVDGEKTQYWMGWGRRKTACAIVRILKGNGQFIVNGREAIEYFQNYPIHWLKACEPMAALSAKNDFDMLCKAFGGGKSGQAGAIRLAVSRAMQEYDFNWRPLLKRAKYLTRDWRMVEPKKTGQPKARKKTPYHKR